MKKMFLTSLFATMVAMPAFADNNSYTNNQTYENSCTVDVLGESSGTAPATAQWSTNSYTCAAGTYLPDGDTWTTDNQGCTACPANSYCGGDTYTYSEANDQGITACSSVGNGTYTLSDGSSSSADSCYRNCAAADVAHLKSGGTVSGRFYSNNTNQCEPANAQQCATGYSYVAGLDLTTTIGVTEAGTGYTSNDYMGDDHDTNGMSNTIIANDPMAFAVDYGNGKGVIKGHGRCSKTGVTTPWYYKQGYTFAADHFVNNLTNETDPETGGGYCYCQLDSYTASGSNTSIALSAPWVFRDDSIDADACADVCAFSCANGLRQGGALSLAFRAAVFGTIPASLASCQANTITVNWGDGDNNPNNNPTTQCTYDGDLVTPTAAPTKRGHTFTGWTFSTQQ